MAVAVKLQIMRFEIIMSFMRFVTSATVGAAGPAIPSKHDQKNQTLEGERRR